MSEEQKGLQGEPNESPAESQSPETEPQKYWEPVAELFQRARTRREIRSACAEAKQRTGVCYCFGIGRMNNEDAMPQGPLTFGGWLFDEDHDRVVVWYTSSKE